MGSCFSTGNKHESALHHGEDLTAADKSGNGICRSSGKASSVAVASNPQPKGEIWSALGLKNFCFSELMEATGCFNTDNLLGQGNSGRVFKGWVDEHTLNAAQPETGVSVAVKMLNQRNCQGLEELVAELKCLARFCHPNLVKLIGYCLEYDRHLLVYEFMPRGSLERHIFGSDFSYEPLSWNLRMKVALGAAKGLAFLHDQAHVIYRDFKSSDVLLIRDGPRNGETHVSTRVLGSEGYSAPEYVLTGHLTVKNDVYSFGVVFLEMLSGRQAIDKTRPLGEQRLVSWAGPLLNSRRHGSLRVLDCKICNEIKDISAVWKAFNLAFECLSRNPLRRPDMKQVVKVLEQLYTPNEN